MAERLTAMDIERQEFKRKMRGLDPDDVQLFLKAVADEVERLNLQNVELQEEAVRLRAEIEEFRSRERTLQQTLVAAQTMSNDLTGKAKQEAELILREARHKSERVLQGTQDQLARLESEISRRKLERDLFEKRLRGMLEEHIGLLEHDRQLDDSGDKVRHLRPVTGSESG